jgi:hypothetical protein
VKGRVIICALIIAGWMFGMAIGMDSHGGRLDYLESENVRQQDQIANIQAQTRQYQQAIQELLKQQAESTAQIVLPASTCTLHDIYVQNPGC